MDESGVGASDTGATGTSGAGAGDPEGTMEAFGAFLVKAEGGFWGTFVAGTDSTGVVVVVFAGVSGACSGSIGAGGGVGW